MADGVLMTGGADIHPERYGHAADTARCGAIDMERDRIESELLRAVDSLHLPCLGVCRGLQFMNVHNGGTLHSCIVWRLHVWPCHTVDCQCGWQHCMLRP